MAAFLVFEGTDGSGKSTQIRSLLRRLRRRGYQVVLTREPGGTPLGEVIRRQLKTQPDITPTSELLLFEAARSQVVDTVIRPALLAGSVVLTDRFTASTVAYQGHGRGLDLESIHRLNDAATGGLTPDLTILLDLHFQIGLARKPGTKTDNFETESAEFYGRVRESYRQQANGEPNRWLVVDATRPPRQIAEEIWQKIQPLLVQGGAAVPT